MTATESAGAVFFDRDGVLNEDAGYVYRQQDFVWMPGAVDAIRRVRALGWHAIVVTNQSGVARGFYQESDIHKLHDWMQDELLQAGTRVSAFYHCPFNDVGSVPAFIHPDHPDRKPNPGMIMRGMKDFAIDPAKAFIIGDKMSDVEAGQRAKIGAFLFDGTNLDEFLVRCLNGGNTEKCLGRDEIGEQ